MSASIAAQDAAVTPSTVRVTQTRVLRSEWTKLWSVRSTGWTLAVAVLLMVGLGALFTGVTANQWDGFDTQERANFDPVGFSLGGLVFAQLAIGVLGVLAITGEYSTGMIRASLTAVPRRLPVLWAKVAVFTVVVLAVTTVTSFAAFFVGQVLLSAENLDVSLSEPGALRAVVGAALYMTLAGVIAVALGTLLRNTAAGISTFVGAFFVVPPLMGLLPSSISDRVVPYLPSSAGESLYGGFDTEATAHLSPWTAFAVLCAYAAGLVAAAAWRLRHADA